MTGFCKPGLRALGRATAAAGLSVVTFCTNYSTQPQTVNPPVLLSIAIESPGHAITLAAQNVEPGFTGYRIFTGTTEGASRGAALGSGTDCFLALLPNQPIQYIAEVKPGQQAVSAAATSTPTRLCAAPLQLVAGQYVTMRSLIFRDFSSVDSSISSNALLVP